MIHTGPSFRQSLPHPHLTKRSNLFSSQSWKNGKHICFSVRMYFLGFPRVVKVNLLAMLAICLQNIIERTIIFCQKDTLNFFLYRQQSLNNTYSTAPYRRDPLKSGIQIGLGSPLTPLVYLVLLNFVVLQARW